MVPYGRKSGTEHLKEKQKRKKKKMIRAPSRSIKFYGHVPRVEICNEITTCFQIYKKVSPYTTHFILFYLPNGGKFVKKARFLKVF